MNSACTYRVEDGSTYLVTILGRLYVNKREEQSRALVISPLASRRLLRTADRIERDFRENFLPQFIEETRLLNVADFEKLSTADLVAEIKRLHDRFVFDTHVAVDVVNIAAGFYLDRARKVLSADAIDPSSLLGHIPETHEARAIAEINAATAKSRRWLLLKNFGHRAVLDYELAEPRYAEDLNTLNRMVAGRVAGRTARLSEHAGAVQVAGQDRRHRAAFPDAEGGCQASLAQRDGGAAARGADARPALRTRRARVLVCASTSCLSLNGQNAARLRELARARQEEAQRLRHSSVAAFGAAGARPRSGVGRRRKRNACHARRHPWHARVRQQGRGGRACVISEEDAEVGNPMEGFRDGDIVVASMINPAWLPYFSRAGGFVSEVGGWLSHPAILAREYDVAMIVGTEGIGRIADGDRLRLNLDGRIEIVAAERMLGQVAAA